MVFLGLVAKSNQGRGCLTLFHPTKAIEELLGCAHWSFMDFCRAINELKALAKLPMKLFCVITNHVQSATLLWALGTKGGHNYIPTMFN
jgi:hypothetical protein